VDGCLTYLGSILEDERLAKGDSSLESLQKEGLRQSEKK